MDGPPGAEASDLQISYQPKASAAGLYCLSCRPGAADWIQWMRCVMMMMIAKVV